MASVSKRRRKQPNGSYRDVGWQVRFVDPDGAERRRSFDKKRDADRFAAEVETQKARGAYVDAAAGKLTFREVAEEWRLAQPHRETTAEQCESRLRLHVYPAIGDRPIGHIRRTELQALVKDRAQHMAPASLEVVVSYVTSVFNAAVLDRRIAVSPAVALPLPRVAPKEPVVPFTDDEVAGLVAALPGRWQLAAQLGEGAGLRIGEVLGLTVDRVEFLRRDIRVDRQMVTVPKVGPRLRAPKTPASTRTIPIPADLVALVSAHVAAYECPDGLLFSFNGGAVNKTRWSEVWTAAVAAAGLPKGTRFHRMRHTYASALIAGGCSVKVVQARLGHKSAQETLDTYGHMFPDDEDRTRDAISAVFERRSAQRRPTALGITRSPG